MEPLEHIPNSIRETFLRHLYRLHIGKNGIDLTYAPHSLLRPLHAPSLLLRLLRLRLRLRRR